MTVLDDQGAVLSEQRYLPFGAVRDDVGTITQTDFGYCEASRSVVDTFQRNLPKTGLMEEEQVKSNIGTEYDLFKRAGLDVFLDGNEGQMHHKTMIVDERIVITGSYNFSRSAEIRNDENVIIFYNETIAAFFLQEFQRVYAQAQQ